MHWDLAHVKSMESDERGKIMQQIGTKVSVPAEHVASMKATLNM